MTRAFRFGVSARYAASRAEWQEKARRAEALGFSTLLIPDHLVNVLPPLTPLVSAAEATERLRVGTFVLNNDFRHPVMVAREAAAIDLLTDGRLELGMGAGHMASEYREAGLAFDRAAIRVERLAESVRIVKGLLRGEDVNFAGRHYQVSGHRVFPQPVQQPAPPILIGGNGRQLLALGAEEADIVGLTGFSHRKGGTGFDFSGFSDHGTRERVEHVRACAGDRFGDLELNALLQRVLVTGSVRSTIQELSSELGMAAEDLASSPYLLIGSHDAIADALVERRQRHGISYWVTFEHSMDALAPVIARLAGR